MDKVKIKPIDLNEDKPLPELVRRIIGWTKIQEEHTQNTSSLDYILEDEDEYLKRIADKLQVTVDSEIFQNLINNFTDIIATMIIKEVANEFEYINTEILHNESICRYSTVYYISKFDGEVHPTDKDDTGLAVVFRTEAEAEKAAEIANLYELFDY